MMANNERGRGEHTDTETVNCLISIHFKSMELIGEINDIIEVIDQVKLKASLANEITYINMRRDRYSHNTATNSTTMDIDTIIHFHIEFPKDTQDWSNVMLIELVIASKLVPSHFTVLGQSQIHLHQIANETPFSAIATLSNDNSVTIAHVDVDCGLNYGILGYGESLQLHSSYKNMEERLQWTTFPRINNPLIPHSTATRPHSSLLSRERNVYNHIITDDLKIPQPPSGSILSRKMTKLQDWILQCQAIKDRHKKMEFIEQLTQSSSQRTLHPLQPTGIITRQTIGGSIITPY